MAKFNLKPIKYVHSYVKITSISNGKEIISNKKIVLRWKLKYLKRDDIQSLVLYRAIFPKDERIDLSKSTSQKRFEPILTWDKEEDVTSFPTSYTDSFSYNTDNNLFVPELDGDIDDYTEEKFNERIRDIGKGRRGIFYKIIVTTTRLDRGATPMGFFCKNQSIVAISTKNQIINDKFYKEGDSVWETKIVDSPERMLRVAVNMDRSLDYNDKKERTVWATSSKGTVVCLDYWTGKILGQKSTGKNMPILAMAYDYEDGKLMFHNGVGDICSAICSNGKVSIVGTKNALVEAPTNRKVGTEDFAWSTTGGVCVNEIVGSKYVPMFYFINNNERVQKVRCDTMSRVTNITRGHFGCTKKNFDAKLKWGGIEHPVHVGATADNQRNIFGICAGINGQVWVNGHTPISYEYATVLSSGNPIIVTMRPGGLCHTWCHADGENILTAQKYNNMRKGVEPTKKYAYNQHFGKKNTYKSYPCGQKIWNESAKEIGETRSESWWKSSGYSAGCKFGLNGSAGLAWIKYEITKDPKKDQREIGKGLTLTDASIKKYTSLGIGPDNKPASITRLHQELVKIEDDTSQMKKEISDTLQDCGYIYGCTTGENIWTSNGQFEDAQDQYPAERNHDYRSDITVGSGDTEAKFYSMARNVSAAESLFMTTTNLFASADSCVSGYLQGVSAYGYVGDPMEWNNTSEDITVIKPFGTQEVSGVTHYKKPIDYVSATSVHKGNLPLSMVGMCARNEPSGNLRFDRTLLNGTSKLEYEIFSVDRRERKLSTLFYSTNSTNEDITTSNHGKLEFPKRSEYSSYKNAVCSFWPLKGRSGNDWTKGKDQNDPYHVNCDADGNPWIVGFKHLGKINILDPEIRLEKYLGDEDDNSWSFEYAYNSYFDYRGRYLMNKFAAVGLNGMTNGESIDLGTAYMKISDDGDWGLSSENNRAYVYNCETASANRYVESLEINDFYGKKCETLYTLNNTTSSTGYETNAFADCHKNMEYNSDNFGMACIYQMDSYQLEADYAHPVMLDPTAETCIIEASSKTDTACDEVDEKIWNTYTNIYNAGQSCSGFDDLSTMHTVENIDPGTRTLIDVVFDYTDDTVNADKHQIEVFEDPDSVDINTIVDHMDEINFWKTPNHQNLKPPYGDISTLPKTRECKVDVYLEYKADVYIPDPSITVLKKHLGTHDIHVFERWPTPDFCADGISKDPSNTDQLEGTDIVGSKYWGDCGSLERNKN